jgi:hypothetical protein
MAPLLVAALPSIFEGVKTLIDRVIPDKAAAEKAKQELESTESKAIFENALAQIAVNVEEAKSTNWFVAGWRPACGWIGALALGYAAILEPVSRFIALVWFDYKGPFPQLDTTITMQILFGILGLGAYRTAEKIKKN